MNIVNKLKHDVCTPEEACQCLESPNPIVVNEAILYLVRNHATEQSVIDRLMQLSGCLSDGFTLIGYYKLGHAAMGALLQLGVDEEKVFGALTDPFEKEMVFRFSQFTW